MIIALIDADFEDLEHRYPVVCLREEGAQVDLVGPEAGKYMMKNMVFEPK